MKPATLFKKRLWQRCFPVIFVKFQRTPFYRTPLGDCFCLEITRIKKRQKELSGDQVIAKRVSCSKMFWNFSLNICFCKVEGHRNFEKFIRTHFLQNTSGRLLLNECMSFSQYFAPAKSSRAWVLLQNSSPQNFRKLQAKHQLNTLSVSKVADLQCVQKKYSCL